MCPNAKHSWSLKRFTRLLAAVVFSFGLLASLPATAQVSYLQLQGNYGYQISGNGTVTLQVPEIENTSSTYTTGTLRVELWAFSSPYNGGSESGWKIAQYQLHGSSNGQLGPNQYFSPFTVTVPVLTMPPDGSYSASFFIDEYSSSGCSSSDGFCVDVWENFSDPLVIGSGASAPSCTVTVTPMSLPSSGGTVTAQAECTGSPSSYNWSDTANLPGIGNVHSQSIVLTYGQNFTYSPWTDTVTVSASNSTGSSLPVSATVTIAAYSTTGGFSIGPGITGSWYDPSQSGHGFEIEVLAGNPSQLLVYWFVFGPTGGQAWIVGVGPINGNQATLQGFWTQGLGGLFPPNFDASRTSPAAWGTLDFSFSDCNHAVVQWNSSVPGYGSGSLSLTRLTLPAGLTCP